MAALFGSNPVGLPLRRYMKLATRTEPLDGFPLISLTAPHEIHPQQFIHGGDTAKGRTTDLVYAKANGDIEAARELMGELGGSQIRLLFADNFTLADSERGCNCIAKS